MAGICRDCGWKIKRGTSKTHLVSPARAEAALADSDAARGFVSAPLKRSCTDVAYLKDDHEPNEFSATSAQFALA